MSITLPRILFIAGTLGAGGAEKQLAYQVRVLREAGVTVEVLSLDGEGHYGEPMRAMGARVDPLTGSGGRIGRFRRILARARAFRPDIVQAAHTHANLYAWAAARATGALSIGALRGAIATSFETIGRPARWHLSAPDAIVSNSYRAAAEMQARLRSGQALHVLENAIDLGALESSRQPRAALRRMARAGDDDVLALVVGSLRRNKGFDRFVHVVADARRRVPALRAAIIGDGPEMDALAAEITRAGMDDVVMLLGRHVDAVTLLAGADIFLLTSENEGLANTLLESMAAGLPSIVTPAGDAERVITQSGGGVVCAKVDGTMAAALAGLAERPADRAAMGAGARRYVETHFDLELLWPRMQRIYREIALFTGRRELAERFGHHDGGVIRKSPKGFYDLDRPVNRFLYEEYRSVARTMLVGAGFSSLDGVRVLDVGCGHAQWLCDFRTWGVPEDDLAGIDLDPARIQFARGRLPDSDLRLGNAGALPWGDHEFDIVVQSTLFTSVLDKAARETLAREMVRVLRPGGIVLWYDFVYNNPRNRSVRGIPVGAIEALFPSLRMEHRSVTLAPPLARLVVPVSMGLARLLDRIPLLRTHALVTLQKPNGSRPS